MKLLKIRVRSDNKGNMVYPQGLLDINCLEQIYCDDVANNICWFVGAIKDEDLPKIKDMTDVTLLTEQEAEIFTADYDKVDNINPTLGITKVKFIDRVKLREKDL